MAAIEGFEEARTMTQIEMARQGTISSEMEHVARREGSIPSWSGPKWRGAG